MSRKIFSDTELIEFRVEFDLSSLPEVEMRGKWAF